MGREGAKGWVDLISEWRLLIVDCWFFWKNEPLRHESRKGAKDWVDFRMTILLRWSYGRTSRWFLANDFAWRIQSAEWILGICPHYNILIFCSLQFSLAFERFWVARTFLPSGLVWREWHRPVMWVILSCVLAMQTFDNVLRHLIGHQRWSCSGKVHVVIGLKFTAAWF